MSSRLEKSNDRIIPKTSAKEAPPPLKEKPKERPKEKIEVSLPTFNRPAKEDIAEEKVRGKKGRKKRGESEKIVETSDPKKSENDKDESKKQKDLKKEDSDEEIFSRKKLPGITPRPGEIKAALSSLQLRIFCEDGRTIIADEKSTWKSVIDGSIVALDVYKSEIILCTLEGELVFLSNDSGRRSELTEYVGPIHSFALFQNMMLLSTVDGTLYLRDLDRKIPDVQADLGGIPNPREVWVIIIFSDKFEIYHFSTRRGSTLLIYRLKVAM